MAFIAQNTAVRFEATTRQAFCLPTDQTGVSFKPLYFEDIETSDHPVGWFEIHAENYMVDGGPMRHQLERLRQSFPVSCHGVGLSIGSSEALDGAHLDRLLRLVDWLEPAVFSEHLAWSSHGGHFFNDLLPLPYTRQTLKRVVDHIDQVQSHLSRTILLENPSTYVSFPENEMSEAQFLSSVVAQTGCELLLDINNVYVSCTNQCFAPDEFIDALPIDTVKQIHLAGHAVDRDDDDQVLLIDSHNAKVTEAVWDLYERIVARHGRIPTLIEWDGDLPEFSVLVDEALEADRRAQSCLRSEQKNVAG